MNKKYQELSKKYKDLSQEYEELSHIQLNQNSLLENIDPYLIYSMNEEFFTFFNNSSIRTGLLKSHFIGDQSCEREIMMT